MKVYISGPISGLTPEEYHANFERGAEWCVKNEHEVVNPLQIAACELEDCWELYAGGPPMPTPGGGAPSTFLHHYRCYMKYDIIAILDCDAMLMLPFWMNSKGAKTERAVAMGIGLKIGYLTDDYSHMSGGWAQ